MAALCNAAIWTVCSEAHGAKPNAVSASSWCASSKEHCSVRQQRSGHPVPGRQSHRRAGLKAGQQRAGAGNCAPGHGGGPGHHGRPGGRARKQHRRAAELADHGSLQQGRPVGLYVLEGVVATKHHGGHERLHRLGQQRHAGHGGRQLRPQDGGGPALPGHSGEDHAFLYPLDHPIALRIAQHQHLAGKSCRDAQRGRGNAS